MDYDATFSFLNFWIFKSGKDLSYPPSSYLKSVARISLEIVIRIPVYCSRFFSLLILVFYLSTA